MAITWAGTAWVPSTAYVLRDRVVNGGNVYECITAGTSAGAGGPSGTGSSIADGGAIWQYMGADGGTVASVGAALAAVAADAQRAILAMVARMMNATEWEDLLDDGSRYLAAHLATLSGSRGKGPVTAEAVGSLSRSYASLAALGGSLWQTSYGAEFYRMQRLLPAALGAVY